MKSTVFFDLDGTLTDPKAGILGGIRHALTSMGIPIHEETLLAFIGPPLRATFMKLYGMDARQAEHAVEKYREYYSTGGLYECELFPGIEDMLRQLRESGRRLAVATSKPTVYAVPILEHYGISHYFDCISGCELDGTNDTKSEVIAVVLEKTGAAPEAVMMVGDREYDVLGAREHGIDCVGVTFGYGGRDELARAGAAYIVDTVTELTGRLLAL